jgi:hypothetical protein
MFMGEETPVWAMEILQSLERFEEKLESYLGDE